MESFAQYDLETRIINPAWTDAVSGRSPPNSKTRPCGVQEFKRSRRSLGAKCSYHRVHFKPDAGLTLGLTPFADVVKGKVPPPSSYSIQAPYNTLATVSLRSGSLNCLARTKTLIGFIVKAMWLIIIALL
jgi:hypothetical protein